MSEQFFVSRNWLHSAIFFLVVSCFLVSCGGEDIEDPNGGNTFVGNAASGALLFEQHCVECHAVTAKDIVQTRTTPNHTLQSLTDVIDTGMPLLDATDCTGQCAANVAVYIAAENTYFDENSGSSNPSTGGGIGDIKIPSGQIDPAPVGVRRLNRTEYNNTVRDLLYTNLRPAENFPEDDFGYGFNNIANVLSLSLLHLEQYIAAADALSKDVLLRASAQGGLQVFEAENVETEGPVSAATGGVNLLAGQSKLLFDVTVPVANDYALIVLAGQMAGGPDDARINVFVGTQNVGSLTVPAPANNRQSYQLSVPLKAGKNSLTLQFANDFYIANEADLNVIVDRMSIDGGAEVPGDQMSALPCEVSGGQSCAAQVAKVLGARAWRRPLTSTEVNDLLAVYTAARSLSSSDQQAMETLLKSILMSPHFLFRVEKDPNLTDPNARALNGYELAARLSYFLWSTMPDETLFDLAENGSLLDEQVLLEQVKRMLGDPKSSSLIENFAVQWLAFDDVLDSEPDPNQFPDFDEALVESMRTETRLFLGDWLASNGSMSELLNASYSFLDQELAAHYGVDIGDADGFVRHDWGGVERHGVLGHGSILTMTSHQVDTSPVLRGKWALDKFLCKPPPPPPPGVENIGEAAEFEGLTTRQRFELHSDTSSVCASCHVLMDPIGFALENFDPIGRWRTTEGGASIDATGKLPGGVDFNGGTELAGILANSAELPLCATKHLMTYALGRGIEALNNNNPEEGPDDPLVYQIYSRTLDSGNRIQDIIEEIVTSEAFRSRRGSESSVGGVK